MQPLAGPEDVPEAFRTSLKYPIGHLHSDRSDSDHLTYPESPTSTQVSVDLSEESMIRQRSVWEILSVQSLSFPCIPVGSTVHKVHVG